MSGTPTAKPHQKLYICLLTEEQHIEYLNNRCVKEVIPEVLRLCLEHAVQENEQGDKDVDEAIKKLLQDEKIEHDKLSSNKMKKKSWFARKSEKYVNKTYKKLDTSNLSEIMPKITEIQPENDNPNYKSLWESVKEIKEIRNTETHDYQDANINQKIIPNISKCIDDIVDKLGKLYKFKPIDVQSIKDKFQRQLHIQNSTQASDETINIIMMKLLSNDETINIVMKKLLSNDETINIIMMKLLSNDETINIIMMKLLSNEETIIK